MTVKQLAAIPENQLKIRWFNGGGESGYTWKYIFFFENKETKEKYLINNQIVESFLKSHRLTTNDFRNHKEKESTKLLLMEVLKVCSA